MRVLIAQVELLSKENLRLSKQNEQLWEDLRTGGNAWKPTGQPAGTGPVVSTPQNSVSNPQLPAVPNGVQVQPMGSGTHLVPFLLPPSFSSGGFNSPAGYASPAPSSPQPPGMPHVSSPGGALNPRHDSESSSTTASPSPPLHGMSMDNNVARTFLLAPFTNLLPNLANAAALSALSQGEMHPRSPVNMPTPTLGPLGSMPFLPGMSSLGSLGPLPDFVTQTLSSSPSIEISKPTDKLML
eukprot:TRINITY_DN1107_c0_g1_i1.p1 TRINITY_DN1107_c0_g1~~TRINITY_DN1107_c0_g1_i1.p1  ORF type:complete len:240 (+),score=22.52 TRINITY_DN1107_c0_g1_i1:590-1309(+)